MLLFVMLCWLALFMALAHRHSAVCFCPKFCCAENVVLLGCKRSPFEVQNESFWNAKRVLLESKRSPFGFCRFYCWRQMYKNRSALRA